MTILFTGSKNGDKKRYKDIIALLKEMGFTVNVRDLLNVVESAGPKKQRSFKRDIELCDFIVAEATDPGLSLGLEIATALSKNKHVLILLSNNKSLDDLSDFIRENSSRYVHLLTYNKQNLEDVLVQAIKKLKKELNYVLYVELPNKYGEIIEDMQKTTNKSKKEIIQEALNDYFADSTL